MAKGVISMGIKCPIIREGDDLVKIVTDAILEDSWNGNENKYDINDKDVIGITESVVARTAGLYITVDEIAEDIRKKFGNNCTVVLDSPIYSRNRFSMILKGIARACKKLIIYMPKFDEVGNPNGVNPFTGVNIMEYYKQIVESENAECVIHDWSLDEGIANIYDNLYPLIHCGLHDYETWKTIMKNKKNVITLADICSDKNPDFGLLGTNKATEERLKLFPTRKLAADTCTSVQNKIKEVTGKNVLVLVFGDGCFHSPELNGIHGSSINEFADPVSWLSNEEGSKVFNSTPNEPKLKAIIDSSSSNAEVRKLVGMNKDSNLVGKMIAMGTTPRHIGDLLATNFDTLVGSGSKGCPVCIIQGYFNTIYN